MSNFLYCRGLLLGQPECLILLTDVGSMSDKADSTLTPQDERRPWQSRKPSKPQFHPPCSGKAMPLSQLTMGIP